MEFQHYSQHNNLKLRTKTQKDQQNVCQASSDQAHSCGDCKISLHDELPQEIQHFLHPCRLRLRTSGGYRCNACCKSYKGLSYYCKQCYFNMDIVCAQLPTVRSENEKQLIQHFSHRHPLTVLVLDMEDQACCEICGEICSGSSCCCSTCKFYLHKSCMEFLPQKIQSIFHPCPLILFITLFYRCGLCHKRCSSLTFRCGKCCFHLCLDCFLKASKLPQEVLHFFHPCPLSLRISFNRCNACYELCSGFTYCCEQCDFVMDAECAKLPTPLEGKKEHIQHFIHRHLLTLSEKIEDSDVCCEICGKPCLGPICVCSQCNFHIHKSCMGILPQKIQHFFHQCPLILITSPSQQCYACDTYFSGLTFHCHKCSFYLCVNCFLISTKESNEASSLLLEIQHFFHPCPLVLKINSSFTCNACFGEFSNFTYCCKHCNFYMDVQCVQISSTRSKGQEKHIQHFSHWHLLEIFDNMKDSEAFCQICREPCSCPTYTCSQCNFYLHKSCMEYLSQKIQLYYHRCPLVLITVPSYRCYSCKRNHSGLTYCCARCFFHLCMECSLPRRMAHFLHKHLLTLSKKQIVDRICCNGCGKHCSGPTFGCNQCNFFLHKSCAMLPQEINTFHHPHSLLLRNNIQAQCKLCLKICCHLFAYYCYRCYFGLDIECASIMPTITYQGHKHLLTLVENLFDKIECNACNLFCIEPFVFRCPECNFTLHLLCGPLPCTIKHKCHLDTLSLKDYYVEDDDDDNNFYCDACEKPRDPRLPVYYCAKGCPMICEVKCVITEVIASLRGNRGEVDLRTVAGHITGKVISKDFVAKELEQKKAGKSIKPSLSLHGILDSLNEFERNEIHDIGVTIQVEIEKGKALSENGNMDTFEYSDSGFNRFMNRLDFAVPAIKFPDFIFKHEKSVMVGNYLDPQTLTFVFEELLAKYGDISVESMSSPRVKSLFFFLLCGVVQNMWRTRVVDVNEHELRDWLTHLKMVKHAGFKIEFMFNHLERVARAHFGIQATRFIEDTSVEQEQEIARTCDEMKELAAKLEATKLKMEESKKRQQNHKASVKSATTGLMKQCLKDGLSMKWKPVADGLL